MKDIIRKRDEEKGNNVRRKKKKKKADKLSQILASYRFQR